MDIQVLTPNGLKTAAGDAEGKLLVGGITLDSAAGLEIKNDVGNPVPVSGPLTDTQLRAADIKVTLDGEKIASDQLPTSLGAKTAAESLPVTLSTDGAFSQNFGAKADAAASTDTGSFSHIALLKRLLSKVPIVGQALMAASLPVTIASDQTTLTVRGGATLSTATATISSGQSVTGTIDLGNNSLIGFVAPAAWTTASLNMGVSVDGTNWSAAVLDQYGAAVSSWSSVTASAHYAVDPVAMLPWRYIRFRSGTVATPVNQGADRVFTLVTRPLA